tara:strand:- start:8261 stop:8536 length:276 start_codon:yes stop_codon:yes gene_type:complete
MESYKQNVDPREYRGRVAIERLYIPSHYENGETYDSGDIDGVSVEGEEYGRIVEYFGNQHAGDNVLVNLDDGRRYWFRWDSDRIRPLLGGE